VTHCDDGITTATGVPARSMTTSSPRLINTPSIVPDILMFPLNADWEDADWWDYKVVESYY
jgi:hypothetical protein